MRFLVIAALVSAGSTAYARDPVDLVCSGIAKPTDDAEQIGISIHYRDVRAKDGSSRVTVLRELVADVVFKWSRVQSVDLDEDVPITLAAGKQVRFRGTYALSKPADILVLHLAGKVTVGKDQHPIDVKLPCVDLSI